MITLLIYQYLATLIIYAQLMEKWDIWYIYEGVSIFGLSSRCTNLMDPEIEFVQLILSPLHMTYTVHTYIDKYIPVTFAVNACLLPWTPDPPIFLYTCACFSMPLGFYILVELHSDNFRFECPDPEAWTLVKFLLLLRVAQWKRGDSIAVLLTYHF